MRITTTVRDRPGFDHDPYVSTLTDTGTYELKATYEGGCEEAIDAFWLRKMGDALRETLLRCGDLLAPYDGGRCSSASVEFEVGAADEVDALAAIGVKAE